LGTYLILTRNGNPNQLHELRKTVVAKDESLHYVFYRDAVKAHLELEPNCIYHVAHVQARIDILKFHDRLKRVVERISSRKCNGEIVSILYKSSRCILQGC
jgi:uncharacterized protein YkvS